jgi:hypothetical protein
MMMNTATKIASAIAVVSTLVAVGCAKLNKHNVGQFRTFITDNHLEETFDKWGHFGMDIRIHADDPSSIIPMASQK